MTSFVARLPCRLLLLLVFRHTTSIILGLCLDRSFLLLLCFVYLLFEQFYFRLFTVAVSFISYCGCYRADCADLHSIPMFMLSKGNSIGIVPLDTVYLFVGPLSQHPAINNPSIQLSAPFTIQRNWDANPPARKYWRFVVWLRKEAVYSILSTIRRIFRTKFNVQICAHTIWRVMCVCVRNKCFLR